MDLVKLGKILKDNGQPAFRLKQIKKAVFQDGVFSFAEISTIPKDLRELLQNKIQIFAFEAQEVLVSKNKDAMKVLLKLHDGNLIETVLISPKPARLASTSGRFHESRRGTWSACISCQVGCAMGCRFCATGKMGFKRNLSAEEITDQVLFWKKYLKLEAKSYKLKAVDNISNIVYMGMGEPFNNWDSVSQSIKILTDQELFGFGSRSLSVSTSGIIEGIEKMANEFPQVNLAISLHFANDEKRDRFMPVNKKDNMEALKNALRKYFQITKRKVFLEYIMLDGINDSALDAKFLAEFIYAVGNTHLLHVNLIRYNTTIVIPDLIRNPEQILNRVQDDIILKPSSKTRTQLFKQELEKHRVNATIRKSLGEEIQGACGQLAGTAS